jgi:hypothetical protein
VNSADQFSELICLTRSDRVMRAVRTDRMIGSDLFEQVRSYHENCSNSSHDAIWSGQTDQILSRELFEQFSWCDLIWTNRSDPITRTIRTVLRMRSDLVKQIRSFHENCSNSFRDAIWSDRTDQFGELIFLNRSIRSELKPNCWGPNIEHRESA